MRDPETGAPRPTNCSASQVMGLVGGGSLLVAAAGAAGLGATLLTTTPASAASFTVTNTDDSGTGSLRQAVIEANAAAGADVILFAPGVTGVITLTTGQIEITDDVTITGPGSASLAISGNDTSRIFYIYDDRATALVATISGLTFTNGNDTGSYGGGAIVAWSADTTLHDVVITDSATAGRGGAVLAGYAYSKAARDHHLRLENCVISGNSAGTDGGGVAFYSGGALEIIDSVIEDNTAGRGGGGLASQESIGNILVQDTRISGNTAPDGAGVRMITQAASTSAVFDRVSVVGNVATTAGRSAVLFDHNAGTTEVISSTIADNTGGGIAGMDATSVHLAHTTVAGNSGVGVASVNRGLNIDSSLLADNAGGDLGTMADVNWSLVESPGSNIVAGGNNLTGVDPGLLPLLQASTTAWIRPFAVESAAFNAGDPAFTPPPSTDQTGAPRVVAGRIDMGAFELQDTDPTDGRVVPTFTG